MRPVLKSPLPLQDPDKPEGLAINRNASTLLRDAGRVHYAVVAVVFRKPLQDVGPTVGA